MPTEIGRLPADDLREGQVYSSPIPDNEDDLEVILVKSSGTLKAWINSCPHDGRPLCKDPDYARDSSGKYLECMNHQALFDPKTGLCAAGPCIGDALFSVNITQERGEIILTL